MAGCIDALIEPLPVFNNCLLYTSSVVVLKAQTGYYLSNNNFYEISSKTATFDMSNGIPVENITINVDKMCIRDRPLLL